MHPLMDRISYAVTTDLREITDNHPGSPADVAAGYVIAMMLTGQGYVNGSDHPFTANEPTPESTHAAQAHFAGHLTDADGAIRHATLHDVLKYAPQCIKRRGGYATTATTLFGYIAANDPDNTEERAHWFGDTASEHAAANVEALKKHKHLRPIEATPEGILVKSEPLATTDLRPLTAAERKEQYRSYIEAKKAERAYNDLDEIA